MEKFLTKVYEDSKELGEVMKRQIKTGEEQDVHGLRRFLVFRRGEVAAAKRRTNRRERREGKVETNEVS